MSASDKYNIRLMLTRVRMGGLNDACSSAKVIKFLFRKGAPRLTKEDRITEFIAIA